MRRALLRIFAVVLVLAGIVAVLWPSPPPPPVEVPEGLALRANQRIDVYSTIHPDQVTVVDISGDVGPRQEVYQAFQDERTLISRKVIREGEVLDSAAAAVVGEPWRPATMDFEVVSFPASFDTMVAGQIKPGHRVHVYAYNQLEDRGPGVQMVARHAWVVDARTSSGEEAEVQAATPSAEEGDDGGLLGGAGGVARRDAPASIVTVAVVPEVAWHIVDVLGAQNYTAWVTLAGPDPVTPTPMPPTPTPTATPTPTPAPGTPTPPPTQTVNGDGQDVIHVVLLNWLLDIVDPYPESLGLIQTANEGYTFDYYGRALTLRIRNNTEDKLWAERWDQDKRARVVIDGTEGQQVWFQPGEGGDIRIELIEGASEATVILMDADSVDTCFSATYVADVTIPDGEKIEAGQLFTKTWRVRNNGTCAWPEDTTLTFFRGERMGTTESGELPSLQPGQETEVGLGMRAPIEPGGYRGRWRFKTGDKFFGGELWTAIQVGDPEGSPDGE